jgi:hypothetical protein
MEGWSSCNSDGNASRNRTHSASPTVSLETLRNQYHPSLVGFSVVRITLLLPPRPIEQLIRHLLLQADLPTACECANRLLTAE